MGSMELRKAMEKAGIITQAKRIAIDRINNRINTIKNQLDRMYSKNPITYEDEIKHLEGLKKTLLGAN